jgi:hypothetical protein
VNYRGKIDIGKKKNMKRRGSAVGIATGYGMDGRGLAVRVSGGANFSPLHVIQTISGYRGAPSPGVKRPEHETDQSPSTSAEVMNTWIYTSTTSPYVFLVWWLIG